MSRDKILIGDCSLAPARNSSAQPAHILRRRGNGHRDHRNAIGYSTACTSAGSSQCGPAQPRRRQWLLALAASGAKSRWKARRCLHQRITRLAIAHHVHEAAHRVVLGRKVRDRRIAEGPRHRSVGADPGGKHGLRLRALLPLGLHDLRATVAAISAADATAVCTFMTRTASFSSSPAAPRARPHSALQSASPMMSTGLAFDQVGGRLLSRTSARHRPARPDVHRVRPAGRSRACRCRRHWSGLQGAGRPTACCAQAFRRNRTSSRRSNARTRSARRNAAS